MIDPADQATAKLTVPQTNLLLEAHSRGGVVAVHRTYAPAVRLVELGLATMEETRFGGHRIRLTDAATTQNAASP